jgi:hypothetical protein
MKAKTGVVLGSVELDVYIAACHGMRALFL